MQPRCGDRCGTAPWNRLTWLLSVPIVRPYHPRLDAGQPAALEGRDVTDENRAGAEHRSPGPRSAAPRDSRPQDPEPAIVPGRSCGTCSLCCKVYMIRELGKPAGRWCVHRVRGSGGCGIHPDRPRSCRDFFCSWLVDPNLGAEWKPEVSRFVLSADATHRAIMVTVDPGRPLAWKRAPYYAVLKQFSEVFFRIDQKVLVSLGGQVTVVLPDRDVPLGALLPGDEIVVRREGLTYGASLRRDRAPAPGSEDLRPGSI
jgi:hypothetical protein